MIINEDLLLKFDAEFVDYRAKEIICSKDAIPGHYLQINKGVVELNNYHEDGKEFTLNILYEGQSIGESLLFNEKGYPMFAIARTDCRLLKLPKEKFLKLINDNHDAMESLLKYLSDRLFYKYLMLFNNSATEPSAKIKSLIDYYKETSSAVGKYEYEVPLTRKQIANLTGLRVETVIRTVKKMENEQVLRTEGRKILY